MKIRPPRVGRGVEGGPPDRLQSSGVPPSVSFVVSGWVLKPCVYLFTYISSTHPPEYALHVHPGEHLP